MSYLGELVFYGGGAVAIGFALFRVLGQKWLEAEFAKRLEKFSALDELIGMAIAEMGQRLDLPQFNEFEHASRLSREGNAKLIELEEIIQKRLWSSDTAKSMS